jgi:hypothetical protein
VYDEEVVMAKVMGPKKLARGNGEVGAEKHFHKTNYEIPS